MTVIDIKDEKKVYKEMSLLLWLMAKNWYNIEDGKNCFPEGQQNQIYACFVVHTHISKHLTPTSDSM